MTENDFDANGHPVWVHNESLAPFRQMLEQVIDPELGYNIVGLGLVYDLTAEPDGTVCIEMTTTTTGCPAADYLLAGAGNSLAALQGVTSVKVNLTYDPPWTPERMEAEAKRRFGIR